MTKAEGKEIIAPAKVHFQDSITDGSFQEQRRSIFRKQQAKRGHWVQVSTQCYEPFIVLNPKPYTKIWGLIMGSYLSSI